MPPHVHWCQNSSYLGMQCTFAEGSKVPTAPRRILLPSGCAASRILIFLTSCEVTGSWQSEGVRWSYYEMTGEQYSVVTTRSESYREDTVSSDLVRGGQMLIISGALGGLIQLKCFVWRLNCTSYRDITQAAKRAEKMMQKAKDHTGRWWWDNRGLYQKGEDSSSCRVLVKRWILS